MGSNLKVSIVNNLLWIWLILFMFSFSLYIYLVFNKKLTFISESIRPCLYQLHTWNVQYIFVIYINRVHILPQYPQFIHFKKLLLNIRLKSPDLALHFNATINCAFFQAGRENKQIRSVVRCFLYCFILWHCFFYQNIWFWI